MSEQAEEALCNIRAATTAGMSRPTSGAAPAENITGHPSALSTPRAERSTRLDSPGRTELTPASGAVHEPGRLTVKSDTRQRTELIGVRLTPDEHERFTAFAARKGWSLPALLRLCVEAALLEEGWSRG